MKTKQELREGEIARYVWNKKKGTIVCISLIIVFVAVSVWKWDRLFVDLYTFIKIYLIAFGFGYSIGYVMAFLLSWNKNYLETIVSNARFRHNQRYQRFWTRYLQNLPEEEYKHLPEKIRHRDNKLAVESMMLHNEFDSYSR